MAANSDCGLRHRVKTAGFEIVIMAAMLACTGLVPLAATPELDAAKEQKAATLPTGVSGDWFGRAQEAISAAEYQASWQVQTPWPELNGAWQAPNRAHNFRVYVTGTGFRMIPRTGDTHAWEWGLRLKGAGSPTAITPAVEGDVEVEGNSISLFRDDLVEWFVNDASGFEHGFIVNAPPAQDKSNLALEMELTGNLIPHSAGNRIDLATPAGVTVIRYGGLIAIDAAGRSLPCRLELAAAGNAKPLVRILVDAKAAVYPIEIDPLATAASWTVQGMQANARFGGAAFTAGDVNGDGYSDVIVGAYLYDAGVVDEGRAYLFYGSASGLVAAPAWMADGVMPGAHFGCSVSGAGDVNGDGYCDVIIGADGYSNAEVSEGAVFVFYGSASGLSSTPAWSYEANLANSHLGYSAENAGDVNGDGFSDVIVGAYGYDLNKGRAWLFHGSASGLAVTPNWTGDINHAGAFFGVACASAGDVNGDGYDDVIVGANGYTEWQNNEGAAFVYHGSASGLSAAAAWMYQANVVDAQLGTSVRGAGDVNGDGYSDVIVGAPFYSNGQVSEGQALVFHGSAAGLAAAPAWTKESNQANALLGMRVGPAGDVNGDGYADVIFAAVCYDNGAVDEGKVWVHLGSASGVSADPVWSAEGDVANAFFGSGVGAAGDVNGDGYSDIIVGAYGYNGHGAVFAYYGSPDGLTMAAKWHAYGGQAHDNYGYSVGAAGDVNGDGYGDVIVGARQYDNGEADEGRVFVYHGSAAGIGAAPAWIAEGNQANAYFGNSVGAAGDVNGDGYSDVIIGAPLYDDGEVNEGMAFVYHGSATGLAAAPAWRVGGNQISALFGAKVGAAGDVNGDGYADVIVGDHSYDGVLPNVGRVTVYHGSATGLSSTADWTIEGDQSDSEFGAAIGTAGDVNGDGFSDVVIGACFYNHGQDGEGMAFVYHGSASGLSATANWTAESDQANADFGISVGTAGDVNGDGYSDVIIGADLYDTVDVNIGAAFIYHGSASGLGAGPVTILPGFQASSSYGYASGTAGDVNGDGYSDVIVGADTMDFLGVLNVGFAFVYHGSEAGVDTTFDFIMLGPNADAQFGYSVGTAGDVNGDGFSDIIVGAIGVKDVLEKEGAAYVFCGGNGGGLTTRPCQLQPGSTIPLSLRGMSASETRADIALTAYAPMGREWVRLEWQAAPLGIKLGTEGTITGIGTTWIATVPGGTNLIAHMTGLTRGTPYHWRCRLVYPAGNLFGQKNGPWVGFGANGRNETDFRTHPYEGTPPGDFTGDGISSLVVYDPLSGTWYARRPDGAGAVVFWGLSWGGPGMTPLSGDFNGDGISELVAYNQALGLWYIRTITGTTILWGAEWGGPDMTAVPGDYNGDGVFDLAVYHEPSGTWYVRTVSGTTLAWGTQCGGPGMSPVAGDYNADKKHDLTVYNRTTGAWLSRTLAGVDICPGVAWGGTGMTPVRGDYDGDRAFDLALYNEASGAWYIRTVSGTILAWAMGWGGAGLTAVPGDFDGDGIYDLAIYSEALGQWFVRRLDGPTIMWARPWGGPGMSAVTQ